MDKGTRAVVFAATLGCFVNVSSGYAQSELNDQVAAWNRLPEKPAMREVCSIYLTYATGIGALVARHASSDEILKWEGQELSQEVKQHTNMDPMDITMGGQMIMNALIAHARYNGPIYQLIPGGFPQWAYRSCLKGKELN